MHTRHLVVLSVLAWVSLSSAAADDAALTQSLAKLAKTYRLEVITADAKFPVKTRHGNIEGKPPEMKALAKYTPLFVREFSLYPPELIKRTKLKRIVLCADLVFAGQRRNAIPDYEHDTLYLDVARGDHSKPYQCKVIHHEFFHIIDLRDDGNVYKDERWAALNPAGFKYGQGGRNVQDQATTSVLTDKYPGFLNHYSTTGVEEDKAEMFANLIVEPTHVEDRIKNDAALRAKAVRLRELLAYFCPEMSDGFWRKVSELKRGQD